MSILQQSGTYIGVQIEAFFVERGIRKLMVEGPEKLLDKWDVSGVYTESSPVTGHPGRLRGSTPSLRRLRRGAPSPRRHEAAVPIGGPDESPYKCPPMGGIYGPAGAAGSSLEA